MSTLARRCQKKLCQGVPDPVPRILPLAQDPASLANTLLGCATQQLDTMDAGTSAAAAAVVSELSTSSMVHTKLLACVRGRCQQSITKCVGKSGPCDQRAAMRSARAECRPLREAVMAAARESVCMPYVDRMRPALLRQFGGDVALVDARAAELVCRLRRCRSEEGPATRRLRRGGVS